MIVFGAALLYEETAGAFEWLFNVFFRVMSSDKLQKFITDKDPAINLAVSLVMPQTYHRLCIWHLGQNVYKHLGHIFRAHKSFQSDFSKLLFDYEYEADFLNAWEEMLEKYDLKDNSWLKNIFTLRKKWSMTYGRDTFLVGILCGHALKILDTLNVKDKIFDYYIVKRWTKDATNLMAMDIKGSMGGSDPKAEVALPYKSDIPRAI
ncbi:hypothetical protein FXO37_29946 [Capsicum annuum]|nr:hypothetical protein FXO37_29946 [Capsicum annuum]